MKYFSKSQKKLLTIGIIGIILIVIGFNYIYSIGNYPDAPAHTYALQESNIIKTIVPDNSGGYFVGGFGVSSAESAYIKHILYDGSIDANFTPTVRSNTTPYIYSLALSADGSTLYIGGAFNRINGTTRNNIGAVSTANGSLLSWNPNSNNTIRKLILAFDGLTIYAGGDFTSIGGQSRNKIAAINTSASTATAWNPNSDGNIYSFTLNSDNLILYVSGDFTTIGGQSRNYIAAINTTTGSATSWNPNSNSIAYDVVASSDDSVLYVGGGFTTIGGQLRNQIAALNTATDTATDWNPNTNVSGDVNALSLISDDSLIYVGGGFTTIGGQSRNRIAALNTATDTAITWNPGADGAVYSIAQSSSSTISVGGDFDNIGGVASVNLAIFDRITVTQSGGSSDVTEGGTTDSYTFVLDIQPSADVVVSVTPDSDTTVSSSTLTFTALNWDTPQTITVTAVDDYIAEGSRTSTITHTLSSSDTDFNEIFVPSIMANITDDDTAGVTVAQSTSSTDVVEGGTTDSYTLVLDSQPSNDVEITISPDSQTTVSSSTTTFTSVNWNTPRTITVTAVDDSIVEAASTSTITHTASSSDAGYNGIVISSVTANITDNDTASFTVNESGGSTDVTEGGATDSYAVVLSSEPTANVFVSITPNAQLQVSTTSIVFSASTWNATQTITVTAVNDLIVEGAHTGTVTHTATSSDSNYNGISISSITATITDNDFGGSAAPAGSATPPISEVVPGVSLDFSINDDAPSTNNSLVNLSFIYGLDVDKVAVSLNSNFSGAVQESIVPSQTFNLCNPFSCEPGNYTIYVKYFTQYGQSSNVISKSIYYDPQLELSEVSPEEPTETLPPTIPSETSPTMPTEITPPPSETSPEQTIQPSSDTESPEITEENTPEAQTTFPATQSVADRIVEIKNLLFSKTKEIVYAATAGITAMFITTVPSFFGITGSLADLSSIRDYIAYIGVLFLQAFGLRRKRNPWGTVYDSQTKRPLPLVRVSLADQNHNVIESSITDKQGRYGFLIPESVSVSSQFIISVSKSGYNFPSKTVSGLSDAPIYLQTYHGEPITPTEGMVKYDIPMDPTTPVAIPKPSALKLAMSSMSGIFSKIGFATSLIFVPISIWIHPAPFTIIVGAIFIIMTVLKLMGFGPKPYGVILDKTTGKPLPFALIVAEDTQKRRVGFAVSDEDGRYFLLIPKELFVNITVTTPSHILRSQTKSFSVSSRGWVKEKVEV